jgi:autotransporter-associated beta strand protein
MVEIGRQIIHGSNNQMTIPKENGRMKTPSVLPLFLAPALAAAICSLVARSSAAGPVDSTRDSLMVTNHSVPGDNTDIRDRRAEVAQESQLFRALHFPNGIQPPKHAFSQGAPARKGEGPVSLATAINTNAATPGGIGYGLWYDGGLLEWSNSTVIDFYPITPSNLGQVPSTLYLTATCRAQKGTESLIAYWSSRSPSFAVYDWSQPNDPWQVQIEVATNYLSQRPDEFGINRQMTHIRNGTYYLGITNGQYGFENRVMLFDFSRNGWDLMYATNYLVGSLTNNYYDASTSLGTWGPIVETFDSYTNVGPVGFDLCRLFQDGQVNWLVPSETSVQQNGTEENLSWSTNWQLLAVAPNTSFAAAVSTNNLVSSQQTNSGTLCVTANTNIASFWLNTNVGRASTGWVTTPANNTWDMTVVGIPPGEYAVYFGSVAGLDAPVPQMVSIAANSVATVQAVYGNTQLAPAITQQPLNQAFLAGGNVALAAAITGTAPLACQWVQDSTNLANGGNLSGATSNELTISSASAGNAGNYLLVVTNLYGAVTSSVASLVLTATWPQEDFSDAGGPLTWSTTLADWGNSPGGPYTNVWYAGADAVFEGTGGTVDVAKVTAESLTFNSPGYSLSGGTLSLAGTPVFTMNSSATIGSDLSSLGTGFAVTGAGTLTLSGANSYGGALTISNGTLRLGNSNALNSSSIGTVITNSVMDLNGRNLGLNNVLVTASGGNFLTNSSTTKAYLRNLTLGGNATIDNNGGTMVLGSTVDQTGVLNLNGHVLTKTGSSKLIFNGLNLTGAGNLVINEGTVQLVDDYSGGYQQGVALGGNGKIIVNAGGQLGSARWGANQSVTMPVVLNGGTISSVWPGPNGATYACPIILSNSSTINLSGDYGSATFSGPISGGGALTVTGDASQRTFTGTNTYSGGTTLSAGTLAIGGAGSLGGGNYTAPMVNNATFCYSSSAAQTLAGTISGTGALIQNGPGALTLAASDSYTGATIVSNGLLQVNGSIRASTVTVHTNGILGGTGTLLGAVTLQGGGTLTAGTPKAIGTLSISNSLTLNANSTNYLRVMVTGGMATNDTVNGMAGTLTYAGALVVTNITSDSTPLAAGHRFTLFRAGAYAGNFSKLSLPPLGANLIWNTNQLSVNGTVAVVSLLPVLSGATLQGSGLDLTFSGNSGQAYRILYSTNLLVPLTNWLALTNGTFGTGPASFTDTGFTNPARYYRVISP